MANLNKEIIMKIAATGRPCWVYDYNNDVIDHGKRSRALLHTVGMKSAVIDPSPLKGGHPGGQISRPVAIVEYENGNLGMVDIHQVQLLDTNEQLEENAAAWAKGGLNCTTCRHTSKSYREKPCEDCNACDKWEPKA